jgi:F0F1-type ATP synthase gamma subunit
LSLKDKFQSDDLSDLYLFINNAWKASHYKSMKVYYNYFKNTMKQVPVGFQFFPLSVTSFEKFMSDLAISLPKKEKISNSSHIILEPNKRTIVKKAYDIMMNVIIYGAVLHNKTGEFASRMMAMK